MGAKLELILFFHRTSFYRSALVFRLLRLHFEFIPTDYIAFIAKLLGRVRLDVRRHTNIIAAKGTVSVTFSHGETGFSH
jgi:hypothetical protein